MNNNILPGFQEYVTERKLAPERKIPYGFATHLPMDGVNIREVQELLCHKNVDLHACAAQYVESADKPAG